MLFAASWRSPFNVLAWKIDVSQFNRLHLQCSIHCKGPIEWTPCAYELKKLKMMHRNATSISRPLEWVSCHRVTDHRVYQWIFQIAFFYWLWYNNLNILLHVLQNWLEATVHILSVYCSLNSLFPLCHGRQSSNKEFLESRAEVCLEE